MATRAWLLYYFMLMSAFTRYKQSTDSWIGIWVERLTPHVKERRPSVETQVCPLGITQKLSTRPYLIHK
jgi:hypothetical protein